MTYVSLHGHSIFSTLDGAGSIPDIVKRCKEIGMTRIALTDHGNIYGTTEWLTETKKAGILGLIGCEFYISPALSMQKNADNKKHQHFILIAKNTAGYKQLVKMISRSNNNECYYYKNRLSLQEIAEIIGDERGNLIGITGHMGSTLGELVIVEDENKVWHIKPDWEKHGIEHIKYLQGVFGNENLGIEIQTYEGNSNGFKELVELNRILCKKTGAMPVATCDFHYATRNQAELQRILMCVQMRTTLDKVAKSGADLSIFF